MALPAKSIDSCPFLTSPAEIRTRIYELIFIELKVVKKEDTRHHALLTCRQIHHEGLHFYCSSTILKIQLRSLQFCSRHRKIKPSWAKIRHLSIDFNNMKDFVAVVPDHQFPGLQTLIVDHEHFPGSYKGIQHAGMSDQAVHKTIRSDLTRSWNPCTKAVWDIAEKERTFGMKISVKNCRDEDGTAIDFLIDLDARTVQREIRSVKIYERRL